MYTLRDKSTKSIKIKPSRSLKEEMNVLGLKDSDIFQIQMVWYDQTKRLKNNKGVNKGVVFLKSYCYNINVIRFYNKI